MSDVAAFAAERTNDGALTVIVISKSLSGDTAVTMRLSNFAHDGSAQCWRLTSSNAINRLGDVAFNGSSLAVNLPPQSITLFVLPRATAKASSDGS